MLKIIKIVLINGLLIIALLAVLEAVSRLIIAENNIQAMFNDQTLRSRGRSYIELNPTRGFSLLPGFNNKLYSITADGFRDNGPAPQAAAETVLLMGESTTFGWDVHNDQTYPYYLQKQLPTARVINAGVPSYTSSQVLQYLKEILQQKHISPDLILVNILWNDIWYSTIKNWHPQILIYQQPPQWLSVLNQHSRLVSALTMGFKNQQQVDKDNPQALAKYLDNIQQMIQLARNYHSDIVFIEPPLDADHIPLQGLNEFHIRYTRPFLISTAQQYQQQLAVLLKKQNIGYIRHTLGLANLHQRDLFLDSLHPTAAGNQIMAEDIAEKLKQRSLF